MTLQGDAADRPRRGSEVYTATEEALVARLRMLAGEFTASPDEEFRVVTRARLVATAAVRTPGTETTGRRPPVRAGALRRLLAGAAGAPASRPRTRWTAGLAGAALTVLTLGGLLTTAQSASPGDLLYDLKRGGEQTQLALAGDSGRGLTLLGFATTRLDELEALVGVQPDADAVVGVPPSGGETGLAAGPDVDLVLDTLQTMDAQTTDGTAALTSRAVRTADAGALGVLTDWAADQQAGLGMVTADVPAGARGALAGSRELVDRVAARSSALEAALGCPSGPATQGSDELGPLPAVCAPVVVPTRPGRPVPGPSGIDDPAPTGSSTPGTAASDTTPPSGPTTSGSTTPSGPTTSGSTPPSGPTTSGSTTPSGPTTSGPTTTGPTTSGPTTTGPTTTGPTTTGPTTTGPTTTGPTTTVPGPSDPASPGPGSTGPTGTATRAPGGTAGPPTPPTTAAPPVPPTDVPTPSVPATPGRSGPPSPTPPPSSGSSSSAVSTSSGPVSDP